MVKAVEANTDQPWVVLYVKRWLVAPIRKHSGPRGWLTVLAGWRAGTG